VEFIGIRMVKCFNVNAIPSISLNWCSTLKPLVNPKYNEFRMFKRLYTEGLSIDYIYNTIYACSDRKSISYLYFGYPKSDNLLKKGLTTWDGTKYDKQDNVTRYYPVTTDTIDMMNLLSISWNMDEKNIFKSTDPYRRAWVQPKSEKPLPNRRNDI
jgi:hypothetical protein